MKLSKKALIFKIILPAVFGVSAIVVPLIIFLLKSEYRMVSSDFPTAHSIQTPITRDIRSLSRMDNSLYPSYRGEEMGLQEIVEEELKKLVPGRILFNPPQEMKVGVQEPVEVRIVKTLTGDLTTGLKGRGLPQVKNIEVGTFMKVRLTGDNFDIRARNISEGQVVASEGFTHWEWDVAPLKGGTQTLLLAVTVRIKMPNGDEETHDHPIFRKQIKVHVNLVYTTKGFIKGNWQWLIATIIVPIAGPVGGWIIMKKRKKGRSSKKKGSKS